MADNHYTGGKDPPLPSRNATSFFWAGKASCRPILLAIAAEEIIGYRRAESISAL